MAKNTVPRTSLVRGRLLHDVRAIAAAQKYGPANGLTRGGAAR
jgi:hypothetical protein